VVSIRGALDLFRSAESVTAKPQLASYWSQQDNHLHTIVTRDFTGSGVVPVTRADGMGVPALARARHKLVSRIARLPLVVMAGGTPVEQQPLWTTRTDGVLSPWHRMAMTVDDCFWHGASLWAVERDSEGQVANAGRVPFESWRINTEGALEFLTPAGGWKVADARTVVLIPGPHEGMLNMGGGLVVRAAANLERTVQSRAANPVPLLALKQTIDSGRLEKEEVDDLIDQWDEARTAEGGATAFLPYGLDAVAMGQDDGSFLIQSRNSAAIDVARQAGVPATTVDASNVNSTLTYETAQGRNGELLDDLALYMDPITGRLSLDDVVPRGKRVAFDTSELRTITPTPTGAPVAD
jgi:hypothetical protein